MGHTYTNILIHAIFSTKDRRPFMADLNTRSRQEEFIAFLERHGIDYDERYIWD